MRRKNTEKIKMLCDYVEKYTLEKGYSPTLQEIGDEIGLAKSGVFRYLNELDKSGVLDYTPEGIRVGKTRKADFGTKLTGVYGSIPCGTPEQEFEQLEVMINLPVSIFGKEDKFMLHASGDSMINAGIDDGDLIVLRNTTSAKEGDIVAALDEDGASTLKTLKYSKDQKRYYLHPENDKYSDIYPETLVIQGVLTHVIKAYGNSAAAR